MLMVLLNFLDIFSIPVQLNYKSQFFIKSKIGSITSLVIIALISTMTIFLIRDLFEHTQARVVSKMEFSVSPKDFFLNNENFQIGVHLQDSQNRDIVNLPNQTYFDISVEFTWIKQEQINGTLNTTLTVNKGIIRQCTKNDTTYGIDAILMPKLFCLDKQTFENQSLALGGENTQSHIRSARVKILKCINKPGNQIFVSQLLLGCASYEQVQAKLKGSKVNIGFFDFYLDSTNYNKPLLKVMRLKQFSIDVDQVSRTKMMMRRISVQTDENFFFLDNKENVQEALQFQTYENYYNAQINNSLAMPSIREFAFEIEQKSEYTYRTYGNILEVMAYIGGFYRFLIFIASLFINPLVKKYYLGTLTSDVNKNYEQYEKILQQYSQPISPKTDIKIQRSFFEKLRNFGQQNYSDRDRLIKSNDIVRCMDVTRIIQLSQDIQRLKNIILTKEQKVLFDLIPIPLNFENSQKVNQLGESIKFVQSQDNVINFNLKQCLFQDLQESPLIRIPDFGKSCSIIPDEIKSQRDLQEYQIIINSKQTDRQRNKL